MDPGPYLMDLDADPGGPKTYGSYGYGSRSATPDWTVHNFLESFLPPCLQGQDDGARVGEAAVGRVRGARVPGGSQVPNVLPQVHLDGQRAGEQGRHQPVS
jgi:hypothetical protein